MKCQWKWKRSQKLITPIMKPNLRAELEIGTIWSLNFINLNKVTYLTANPNISVPPPLVLVSLSFTVIVTGKLSNQLYKELGMSDGRCGILSKPGICKRSLCRHTKHVCASSIAQGKHHHTLWIIILQIHLQLAIFQHLTGFSYKGLQTWQYFAWIMGNHMYI